MTRDVHGKNIIIEHNGQNAFGDAPWSRTSAVAVARERLGARKLSRAPILLQNEGAVYVLYLFARFESAR